MIAKQKNLNVMRIVVDAQTLALETKNQTRDLINLGLKPSTNKPLRVALVGSYVPRKCGIATFTEDVFKSLERLQTVSAVDVFAMGDGNHYDYPSEVCFEIDQTPTGYHRAAAKINLGSYDVLFVQHEFGLFGGNAGDALFEMLDRVTVPVMTMLHTVLRDPTSEQADVIKRLSERSKALLTMSTRGKSFLTANYDISEDRIAVVPHGIPDTPPRELESNKKRFGLEGKLVALTFGLIGPGKGLEYAIEAIPEIVRKHPNFVYVLLGATHPTLIKEQGERYREGLRHQAERLGILKHVHFENRFVDLSELTQWIGAADVYLTPYLNEAQITSGTLSYAYGCGTPVVSTPYWHAVDLLAEERGYLVPFRDGDAIAKQVNRLLDDQPLREAMAQKAYEDGRTMVWPAVATQLARLLRSCLRIDQLARLTSSGKPTSTGEISWLPTGEINLTHLFRLTDDTGIIQHATCALPNRHEGYCVDDNARALLLTLILDQLDCEQDRLGSAQSRYVEFVNHAIDEQNGSVRNFMSYSRKWLETTGADDSMGRTSWVLGTCVGRTLQEGIRVWAKRMYLPVLRRIVATSSLRAWCFGLLGVCEYRTHDQNHAEINEIGREFLSRIAFRRKESKAPDWPWFEDRLTYDNAKLPHALLAGALSFDNPSLFEQSLASLEWLCQVQSGPDGCFSPIGSNGFFVRGQLRAVFDQQPVEAWATTSACLAAHAATENPKWFREASKAYNWFVGRNVRGFMVVDMSTGGCFDGLHSDRVNFNQGAESTLSWLLADAEMRLAGYPIPSESERANPLNFATKHN